MDPMTWKKEVLIYKYKSSTTQSLKMKFPFFFLRVFQAIGAEWEDFEENVAKSVATIQHVQDALRVGDVPMGLFAVTMTD